MPDLSYTYTPPVERKSAELFLQTIRLAQGDQELGRACWIAGQEVQEGVVQIIELTVTPGNWRKGHGQRLMEALTEQCRKYFKLRKSRLRRIWVAVDQKRHVIGRSFLM